ncbi:MAG TPA: cyclopropane fatty acyl phospholipid synthase [Spirochaetales bacterium]|nr:cyclopropane fatty acyl phospholipid synthase [Spirochaetales bacterium]
MGGNEERIIKELFALAGVTVNGDKPYDITIHDRRFYRRALNEQALGLGESYMDGWWDCPALDQFFHRILSVKLQEKVKGNWKIKLDILKSRLFNLQKEKRAYQVGERHYDIGNDLYRRMLDKRMIYTCAYWKKARNLDQAQEAKLDLVCRKINLKKGMTVLELGCGWGTFARYAAEEYGAKVTAVTISREQVKLGRELCRGLPVEIKLEDYRQVTGKYDRVISIGIMEHVGYKNYRTYMETVDRTLKHDGIAFVHTIGQNSNETTTNSWTTRYIFPNSMLPSIAQLGKAMEGLFIMEDWHNFGPDYDKTLMAWHANFEKSWPELKEKYGDRFYRIWRYYLLSSAGGFRSRFNQLWQIVMTRSGSEQPDCRQS